MSKHPKPKKSQNPKPPQSKQSFVDPIPGLILTTAVGVIAATIGAFVTTQMPASWQVYSGAISGIAVLIILGIAWWAKDKVSPKRVPLLIVSMITFTVIVLIGYFAWAAFHEQRTVYFLIDASENMSGKLQDVSPMVKLKSMQVPDQVEVGLSIYGGGLSDEYGCADVVQLIKPSPKQSGSLDISKAVDLITQLKPQNYGGLQNAVLKTIDDLVGRKGLQLIVVVTSGVDRRCASLDNKIVYQEAAKKNIDFVLQVATAGDVTDDDKQILYAFARGAYNNAKDSDALTRILYDAVHNPPSPIQRLYYATEP